MDRKKRDEKPSYNPPPKDEQSRQKPPTRPPPKSKYNYRQRKIEGMRKIIVCGIDIINSDCEIEGLDQLKGLVEQAKSEEELKLAASLLMTISNFYGIDAI